MNLTLRRGESMAIVGVNGAGKTTLIKLLCGLYLPSSGQILVDGEPLDHDTVDAWRQRLAVVFQDYCRYPLTVRENVAVGRDDHNEDALSWSASADGTGLNEVLGRLPHGWDTVLSKQFDHGVELSGGQWQRVVLARALYATQAGADVVILDEPTANLDVRSELRVFDAVLDHTQQQTTILVSHRLSTVRRVDRIVVLDDGRVVEDGSHQSLMGRDGVYRRMFRAQAAGFDPDDEPGQEAMLDA